MLPKLSIDLPSTGRNANVSSSGYAISVTHLAARLATTENGALLGVTQGIRILLPRESATYLTVGDERFSLMPGMALVADGRTMLGSGESSGTLPPLHVIECNAVIGDAFPIGELLNLPFMSGAEHAAALQRIFEQIAFGETNIPRLPGGMDISRHLAAINLVATLLSAGGGDTIVSREEFNDDRVPRLRQFLLENLSRRVEVQEMARFLGLSRTALFRWAKQTLGCAPLKYLRDLRLERSQEWIADNSASLEAIAFETGFASRSHLQREFKKHFGTTPAQYRKTAQSTTSAEFMTDTAEKFFRNGRFDEALAACEKGLKSNPPVPQIERLRYQKGLCLRSLGRGGDAIKEWRALRVSGYSHRAGIQECRQLLLAGAHDDVLGLLRSLYEQANTFQREDVVSLWIDQVNALRSDQKPRLLRAYLGLRRELFPHDERTWSITVNSLRMMGDNMEILEQGVESPRICYHALRRAGKYDEGVKRYRSKLSPYTIAQGACLQGFYEDVLAMQPENPQFNVEALVELGRAAEAIKRYPDHSARAYLALGRYEELLKRFPQSPSTDSSRIAALAALDRTTEIDDLLTGPSGEWVWHPALVNWHPEAVLESSCADAFIYTNHARALITINALVKHERSIAEKTLEQIQTINSPDFWWYAHNGTEIIIVALLHGLLGDQDILQANLKEIVAHHKYKDKQAMWHDAAYLTGQISKAEFRAQPQQRQVEERLAFIQAAAHDLEGKASLARKGYETVLKTPTRPVNPLDFLRQRFAEWRLQEL